MIKLFFGNAQTQKNREYQGETSTILKTFEISADINIVQFKPNIDNYSVRRYVLCYIVIVCVGSIHYTRNDDSLTHANGEFHGMDPLMAVNWDHKTFKGSECCSLWKTTHVTLVPKTTDSGSWKSSHSENENSQIN